ncbi:MAG: hydrophobe/amphiphile efflux-1 family RND transporter, partial [Acidobacteria bacterium]
FSLSGGSSSNYGLVFAPLKPIEERRAKGHAVSDIVARVSPKLFGIPGAIVVAFEPPAINGIGSFGGFQFELQDLGRNTLQDVDNVAHQIVAGSRQRHDLIGLFTSFTANDPQRLVQIDRQKAKAIGVPISQITQALGVYMGSEYVNDF